MSEASETPDDTYSDGEKEDEETNNQKSLSEPYASQDADERDKSKNNSCFSFSTH